VAELSLTMARIIVEEDFDTPEPLTIAISQ